MPSCPRAEPTKGARPCLTRACMRSSSALAAHIQPWMRRYSPRLAPPALVACALTAQGHGDLHALLGADAHPLQVVVVEPLKLGEALPLGTLLAQPLDLFDDAAHQLGLRPHAAF